MFINGSDAREIVRQYGSPVYIYSEKILRERCRDLISAFQGRIKPSFSAKANSNLTLLRIIREEGFGADAMSPGEIFILEKAGFMPDEIFYIGNNVSCEEMRYSIDRDILVSVDSLEQLAQFGEINPGGKVAVRFNPGLGAGHCDKVITAGHHTKFGVQAEFAPQVKELLDKYALTLAGINQHIGSLFLSAEPYIESAKTLLEMISGQFDRLEFVDFGGGFGVPYKKEEGRLDFRDLTSKLFRVTDDFVSRYDNKEIHFKCEPGRYVTAESGILLGTVHSVKDNYGVKYVGTDIGFNVMMRHILYGSYHGISVFSADSSRAESADPVTIVGNICESGDILAEDRNIGGVRRGDLVAVSNAGAYGYSMASNYNSRLRPAEVLITQDGNVKLIRRADSLESLIENF